MKTQGHESRLPCRQAWAPAFLPATKSVPKEIMTLCRPPADSNTRYRRGPAAAGITRIHLCQPRAARAALEDPIFDRAPELEASLLAKGKTALLETLEATNMDSGAIALCPPASGAGALAMPVVVRAPSDWLMSPFAVLLPDDVIAADKPCLKQMVEAYAETGRAI